MKVLKTIIFWVLSCTWGILMTLIGAITALFLLVAGKKPYRIGPCVYFKVGQGWGGFELGGFFLVSKDASEHLIKHEAGHGLQNIVFGPLMPFIVSIPSAIRYWLRECRLQANKYIFNFIYLLTSTLIITMAIILVNPSWLIITLEALRIYFAGVAVWLLLYEIPKYKNNANVAYDSVWFEGQATKLGYKYM